MHYSDVTNLKVTLMSDLQLNLSYKTLLILNQNWTQFFNGSAPIGKTFAIEEANCPVTWNPVVPCLLMFYSVLKQTQILTVENMLLAKILFLQTLLPHIPRSLSASKSSKISSWNNLPSKPINITVLGSHFFCFVCFNLNEEKNIKVGSMKQQSRDFWPNLVYLLWEWVSFCSGFE